MSRLKGLVCVVQYYKTYFSSSLVYIKLSFSIYFFSISLPSLIFFELTIPGVALCLLVASFFLSSHSSSLFFLFSYRQVSRGTPTSPLLQLVISPRLAFPLLSSGKSLHLTLTSPHLFYLSKHFSP